MSIRELADFVGAYAATARSAVIECVGPMTGQGLASTAHFMAAYGLVRGVFHGLGIEYRLVVPSVWKRALLPATAFVEKDPAARKVAQKAAAVAFVAATYPSVNLVRGRCRNPDHDLAEALCMAHHAKTQYAATPP